MRRRGLHPREATALVTGAGAGIGRATTLALAAEGTHVIATDVDRTAAEKVTAEVEEHGGGASAHRLDVTDADAVAELAATVAADHGALDLLVCNAGVGMSARLADMTVDDWVWIRSVNLDGVLHCCHAFGAAMLSRGRGHVSIVSSALGYTPRATEPAYVTTKAAALALAQSLRADWSPRGVGVSTVCPGIINTGIHTRTRFIGTDPDHQLRTSRTFERGRGPERVAAAIVRNTRRNRAVVPVGWEARLAWWAHRFAPVWVQQIVARQPPL